MAIIQLSLETPFDDPAKEVKILESIVLLFGPVALDWADWRKMVNLDYLNDLSSTENYSKFNALLAVLENLAAIGPTSILPGSARP